MSESGGDERDALADLGAEDEEPFDLVSPDDPLEVLTPQLRVFVMHYVGGARFNASESARRAGYSPKGVDAQSARLMQREDVRRAVAFVLRKHMGSLEESLSRMHHRANGTVRDILSVVIGQDGKVRRAEFDIGKMIESGQIDNVQSVKQGKYGLEFRFYDAQRADEFLARAYGANVAEDGPAGGGAAGSAGGAGLLTYPDAVIEVVTRESIAVKQADEVGGE